MKYFMMEQIQFYRNVIFKISWNIYLFENVILINFKKVRKLKFIKLCIYEYFYYTHTHTHTESTKKHTYTYTLNITLQMTNVLLCTKLYKWN